MTGAQVEGIDPSIWDKCLPFKIKVVMDSVSELSQITAVGSTRNTDSTISLSFDEAYVGKEWTVTGGVESYSGRVTAALQDAVTLLAPLTEYSFTCDHRSIEYTTENFGAAGAVAFDVSVLTISFDAEFEGETYEVTGNGETYTGTVSETLTAEHRLQQLNTSYQISCAGKVRTITTGDTASEINVEFGTTIAEWLKIYKGNNGRSYAVTTLSGESYEIACSLYGEFGTTSHSYELYGKTVRIELTGRNLATDAVTGTVYVDETPVLSVNSGPTNGGNGSYTTDYTSDAFEV